jgi:hypothetical protein
MYRVNKWKLWMAYHKRFDLESFRQPYTELFQQFSTITVSICGDSSMCMMCMCHINLDPFELFPDLNCSSEVSLSIHEHGFKMGENPSYF